MDNINLEEYLDFVKTADIKIQTKKRSKQLVSSHYSDANKIISDFSNFFTYLSPSQ
jgi:hypothetical protein